MDLSGSNPMDFSTLVSTPTTGSYVQETDEAGFDGVARSSMTHPVLLEFYSPRSQGGDDFAKTLADVVNARGGKVALWRINVDVQQRIAQALQIQAVPTVIALIAGQAVPLFQGTAEKADIERAVEQVVATAVANGITGSAQPAPVGEGTTEHDAPPAADPRFAAADAALVAGDFALAVAEFDKLLSANPSDTEAVTGRAQASLLQRSIGFDAATIIAKAQDDPTDLAAALDAADLEVIQGAPKQAFDRLLTLMASADTDVKEQLRVRLLELFETIGRAEPVVLAARRKLSGLLF